MRTSLASLALLAPLLHALGCNTKTIQVLSTACTPEETAPCLCSDGRPGIQECSSESTYGECLCGEVSSSPPPGLLDGSAPSSERDGSMASAEVGHGTTVGPVFLSFGTNVTAITEGGSVTFTSVVTHSQGTDALAGGSLVSPDGTTQYGPFTTGGAQKGAYSLTLSWAQIDQSKTIDFTSEEKRDFVAEFFDTEGRKSTKPVTIRLHCNGNSACSGKCSDLQTDDENCGKCGHKCLNHDCSLGKCVDPEKTVYGGVRESCDATCAKNGGTCVPAPTNCPDMFSASGISLYDSWNVMKVMGCSEVPPATYKNNDFDEIHCCCTSR